MVGVNDDFYGVPNSGVVFGWEKEADEGEVNVKVKEVLICTNFKDHKDGQKKILQEGKEVCECGEIPTIKVRSMIRA